MITYNHERFIRQAIESVLMQKANFAYELVIGEDRSTDRTRDIVLELQQKHPDRIRLLLAESNLGANLNFIRTLNACGGQYVATLDGDDYWISPFKLQKQVDFLDAHPECSICFHPIQFVFEKDFSGQPFPYRECFRHEKDFFKLEDLLRSFFMRTCSVMFRGGSIGELPSWFVDAGIRGLDWALHILVAQHGKVGFIDEVMATYRIHAGGLWTSKMNDIEKAQDRIRMLDYLNAELGFRYDKTIVGTKSAWHLRLALEWARKHNLVEARKYAKICTAEYWQSKELPATLLIVMWLRVYFPSLFDLVLSSKALADIAHRVFPALWVNVP
jgi:glycosyltransferase involved in cell wall biosynthesis